MAKVLLVEDDVNLREIYAARLQSEGYETLTADDGENALAIAVKEKPDLIILDVMMPKISGFDVLDILRSTPETKNAKIMMMTALSQEGDKERGQKLGANRYLVKSQVTLEDMVANAKQLLEEGGVAAPVAEQAATPPAPEPTPEAQPAVTAPQPEIPESVAPESPVSPVPQAAEPAPAEPVADQTAVAPQPEVTPEQQAAPQPEIPAIPPQPETPVAAPAEPVMPTEPIASDPVVTNEQSATPAPQPEPATDPASEPAPLDDDIDDSVIATPGTVIQPTAPAPETTENQA